MEGARTITGAHRRTPCDRAVVARSLSPSRFSGPASYTQEFPYSGDSVNPFRYGLSGRLFSEKVCARSTKPLHYRRRRDRAQTVRVGVR